MFPSELGKARKKFSEADRKRLKKALKAAGIAKDVRPHDLRTTFGTAIYESTGDVKTTQRLLRHGHAATTMRHYVHDRRDLREAVNAIDPGSNRSRRLKAVD